MGCSHVGVKIGRCSGSDHHTKLHTVPLETLPFQLGTVVILETYGLGN